MGIKFHCPNGHKLNVKSFLAGKKGVCPHCGATFRIPLESERKTAKPKAGASTNGAKSRTATAAAESSGPAPIAAGVAAGTTAGTASASSAAPLPAMPQPAVAAPIPSNAPALPSAAPVVQSHAPTATATASVDVIDQAPNAVWYVRPPTGGQYGPARGDIMRRWITEGRVSADSLVWREGWAEWEQASNTFPSLATTTRPITSAPSIPVVAPVQPAVAPLSPTVTTSSPRTMVRARRSNALNVAIVVTLALVAIGLMVALVVVLNR